MIRSKMKRQIFLKCTECAYDPYAGGMKGITECLDTKCPLWGLRPSAKLDKSLAWEYVGFDKTHPRDIRGEWISSQPTEEEKQLMEKRKEIGAMNAERLIDSRKNCE